MRNEFASKLRAAMLGRMPASQGGGGPLPMLPMSDQMPQGVSPFFRRPMGSGGPVMAALPTAGTATAGGMQPQPAPQPRVPLRQMAIADTAGSGQAAALPNPRAGALRRSIGIRAR